MLQNLLRKALTCHTEVVENFGQLFYKNLIQEAYQTKQLDYLNGIRPNLEALSDSNEPVVPLRNELLTTTVELPSHHAEKVPISSFIQVDTTLEVYQSFTEREKAGVTFVGDSTGSLRTVWPNMNKNGSNKGILDSGSKLCRCQKTAHTTRVLHTILP